MSDTMVRTEKGPAVSEHPGPWTDLTRRPIMPKSNLSPTERFWAKVDRRDPTECWLWLAGLIKATGYGNNFWVDGRDKYKSPHRFAYEITHGPIPDGFQIDHLCRNRGCVNPAHLEAVTMLENIMRGEGPPAKNVRKTHCLRGHPYEADNVYFDSKGWRQCRACNRAKSRRYYKANPEKYRERARDYDHRKRGLA